MRVASHLALTREVDALREQFEQLARDADRLADPLTDEQFHQRPPDGGWSVAECLDHLNSTARAYLPKLDDAVSDAIRRGLYGEGPFKYGLVARLVVRSMEPPPRFRFKAPAPFLPGAERSRHEITAAFRAYQVQLVDRLRQASGLDLSRARVTSPATAWLRLPLGAALELMVAHEKRHLWQARNVVAVIGRQEHKEG